MARRRTEAAVIEEVLTAAAEEEAQAKAPAAADGEIPAGVPVFVLRADKPRHIQALMAALGELRMGQREAMRLVREFDLYEEAHR
jgi:hypothetical protein